MLHVIIIVIIMVNRFQKTIEIQAQSNRPPFAKDESGSTR